MKGQIRSSNLRPQLTSGEAVVGYLVNTVLITLPYCCELTGVCVLVGSRGAVETAGGLEVWPVFMSGSPEGEGLVLGCASSEDCGVTASGMEVVTSCSAMERKSTFHQYRNLQFHTQLDDN